MLKLQLEQDIKTALLAGDKEKATTLRGLKSSILYAEVAQNKREHGLNDDEIIAVLGKEAKKRQESADLYTQGGNNAKAEAELNEKTIIEGYLPKQLPEDELRKAVYEEISQSGDITLKDMGRIIGAIKSKLGGSVDGAMVARIVKEELEKQ